MSPASRSPRSSDWRDIASLGEQIVNADSLAEQRDRIIAITSKLIHGDIDVWLCEKVFRLPNLNEANVFPEEPELQGMQRAIKEGQVLTKQRRAKSTKARVRVHLFRARPGRPFLLSSRDFCWERFRSLEARGPSSNRRNWTCWNGWLAPSR
jgi:hypothetical protein